MMPACVLAAAMGCATGGAGIDAGRPSADSGGPTGDAGNPDGGPRDAGPVDAGRTDSGVLDASAPVDSGPLDSGTRLDAGAPTCPPTSARVAVVELMISSRSGAGDLGEWVELVNVGDCTVTLAGLQLASPSFGVGDPLVFTIPDGTLAPGARFVLAQSGVASENHGVPHDLTYAGSGIVLDNGDDWLELRLGGATLDRVSWVAGDVVHGHSRMFPDGVDVSMNASSLLWCASTSIYSSSVGGPYRGTPRAPNGTCPSRARAASRRR
jgi:hypothetical protein